MLESLVEGVRPHPGAPLSVFDEPAYIAASARHEGSSPVVVRAESAALVLLRRPDGLRTVYGYPTLLDDGDGDVAPLADALHGLDRPAVVAPAPLGPAVRLSQALSAAGAPDAVRPIACFLDDSGAQPDDERVLAAHASRTRRAIRTARRRGATVEVGAIRESFGAFYRTAMEDLDAAPIYRFEDPYFAAMATLEHFQVTVSDEHGTAAAALFLLDPFAGYYHLGGRRSEPAAVVGAMNLALHEGIVECLRRERGTVVLGGGRTTAADDPLLVFKRQLAPELLPRPVFTLPATAPPPARRA